MSDAALSEKIQNAGDIPTIHALCKQIAAHLSFEHFIYATRIPVSVTKPFHFAVNGYPRAWRDRYEEQGYLSVDPVIAHVLGSVAPICWDEVERSSPTVQQFFDEATSFGVAAGITIPIYGRRGDIGLFSVARRWEITADKDLRTELKQRVHYFAPFIHEAIQRTVLSADGNPIIVEQLTPRERDCLSMAAEGMTSGQIAEMLNVSTRTVTYHVQNATSKLGVHGRQRAIEKAVAIGEIAPKAYRPYASDSTPVIHDILH